MILFIIIMVGILFTIYSILPTNYHKFISFKTIKSCPRDGIMLTFNDGPHEVYTAELLDLLQEHDLKATCFVVEKNTQQLPQLIKRMEKEGHTIVLHSLQYRNAWFYSYLYTKKDFEESLAIMHQIGVKCHYYRPSWGHLTIFSSYFVRKYHLQMLFRTVMVRDWKYNSVSLIIQNKILRSTQQQSIISLHDASHPIYSDSDVPKRMIEDLKTTLPI